MLEKKAKWMAMCKVKGEADWCDKEGWFGKEWCGKEGWLAKKAGVAENPSEAEIQAMLEKKAKWMAMCKGRGKDHWSGKADWRGKEWYGKGHGKARGKWCGKDWDHDSSAW